MIYTSGVGCLRTTPCRMFGPVIMAAGTARQLRQPRFAALIQVHAALRKQVQAVLNGNARQSVVAHFHHKTAASGSTASVSQQSLDMAFEILDQDQDGLIGRNDACQLVAYYLALQRHKPAAAAAASKPFTWDQHLHASITTAMQLPGGNWTAVQSFIAAKLSGGLQDQPPRCSDLVWSGLGVGLTFFAMGLLLPAVKTWPLIGQWHQHGLPLLLGSFGTIAVLLFGRPEAEAVRLWPILAGQLGSTVIAVSVIQTWGASLYTRAAAMAATIMYMMWADCIHPPGGALVLMAMDNAAIQQLQWAYLLWPSLLLCLGVLLPLSAGTNWLRRNYRFDWPNMAAPAASATTPSSSTGQLAKQQQQQQQKQQQWQQEWWHQQHQRQQQHINVTPRITVPDSVVMLMAYVVLAIKGAREDLATVLQGVAHSLVPASPSQQLTQWQNTVMLSPQQQQQWQQMQKLGGQSVQGLHLHGGGKPLSVSWDEKQAAATDWLRARQYKQWLKAERQGENEAYRRIIWGDSMSGVKQFERQLDELHNEHMQEPQHQYQQHPAKQSWGPYSMLDAWLLTEGDIQGAAECKQQQRRTRPAWMYRWHGDVARLEDTYNLGMKDSKGLDGPGMLDSFAPDE